MNQSTLTCDDLAAEWRRAGVGEGMDLIVHSSLSGLGPVDGGAKAVADSLLDAVGPTGTIVVPTFTPNVTDPDPAHVGVPDPALRERRDAVPTFHNDVPSSMGAVSEALRCLPGALRSSHPQASVAAMGARAGQIVAGQPLGFALGRASPFEHLYDLGGAILLIGVGHNRNSFLHHAESLTPHPRLKLRRFPVMNRGQRVWCEALDVADDNDTYFPIVGRDFERRFGVRETIVGRTACRLLPVRPFVDFAVRRLTELLAWEFEPSGPG
ncbi:MAG TPA: AAC(3) family N-acetyltransferase [Amycolatopsis sp.]|uniref:aminoglycoside N(3)-acetyltransferase n=1 Tax=Amycolatopsis sp. TaxID=37632 RepID=UPI002B4A4FD5|nr:AAC(3) family N-acetyltransferase [Amycolatopsis sp.]HKS46945.1 AAC(3) family N-acetyltransferase [Amycolatopsis sp.]